MVVLLFILNFLMSMGCDIVRPSKVDFSQSGFNIRSARTMKDTDWKSLLGKQLEKMPQGITLKVSPEYELIGENESQLMDFLSSIKTPDGWQWAAEELHYGAINESPRWRAHLVAKTRIIAWEHLHKVHEIELSDFGECVVTVELTQEGRALFASFSKERV